MRIALAQMQVGFDKAANLKKMELLVEEASTQGADLIVFPEASMYNFDDRAAGAAEPIDGPFVNALIDLARLHHIWLVAGVFESSADAARAYNTLVLVDDKGKLVDCYRKIHLFDAFGRQESKDFLAGDGQTVVFECAGMTLGLITCYDLRFPELARRLAYQGAQAIVLSAAWFAGPLKEMHLETLCRARAIENNCYVAAALQVGKDYAGSSLVVDPMGVIQASRGELEGLLISELVNERVDKVRAYSPTLKNSRADLYARWQDNKWYQEHAID
ncbi:MAG: carbon-nitrogen hydrolase family protein [Terriglobales bacterium]